MILLFCAMLVGATSADSQYNTFHYANHPYIKYMGHHPGYVVTTPKPEMKHDMKEMKEHHMMPMEDKPPMHDSMPYHAPAPVHHHHQYVPPQPYHHHQPYHAPYAAHVR